MKARPPNPLRHRAFRLYFAGNLVSNSGTWLQNVALSVFMLELTGRSTWVGIVTFALFMPVIFLALPGGALADRVDRLRLLMTTQLFASGLAAVLTALAATGNVNRYVVVAIALGLGAATAVGIPAMQALLPQLVPPGELGEAIAKNAVTFNVARVIGPVVAAATITGLGTTWAFGINAASFLVLAGALAIIGRAPYPREPTAPVPTRDALRYAWTHVRTRTMLFAVAMIGLTLDPITTLSPAFGQAFGRSSHAGWIVAAWGGGAVAAITAGAAITRAIAARGLGWLGLLALGAGIAGLGGAQTLWQALGASFVAGIGYISATMTFTTTIQTDVPDHFRGRVMAIWTLCFLGTRPVGGLIDGKLADAFSPHWAALAFAFPAVVAAIVVRRGTLGGAEPLAPPV